MKRYLLFAGETYQPGGGMNDFRASFDTVEEAMAHKFRWHQEWAHVFDLERQEVVKCRDESEGWHDPRAGEFEEAR